MAVQNIQKKKKLLVEIFDIFEYLLYQNPTNQYSYQTVQEAISKLGLNMLLLRVQIKSLCDSLSDLKSYWNEIISC